MAAIEDTLASFWQRYSYETTLTLGAFAAFWAMHLLVRFIVGPMFKVYRDMPASGHPEKKSKIQFEVLIVSFFHCLSAVALATYVLLTAPPMHPLWGSHPISTIQFAISTGYFLWDLTLFPFYLSEFGLGMLFHAIITSTCFGMAMIPFVQPALTFFLLYELSTLFMDVVFLLRTIGKDSGLVYGSILYCMSDLHSYLLSGICFSLSFFVVRILFGTRMTLTFWMMFWTEILAVPTSTLAWRLVTWHYIVMSMGLLLLNFVWFGAIVKEVTKLFGVSAKPKTA